MAADITEIGQLRWRCRRGMRELDMLLTRYLENQFCSASIAEQEAFRQLLDTQDTAIYAYCLGEERPPTESLAALVRSITGDSREET